MRRLLLSTWLLGMLLTGMARGQDARTFLTLDPGHHVGPITALLFTPDGKRLVSAGEDKTIQVWDVASGARVQIFRPPVGPGVKGAIKAAALSGDGVTLAVGAAGLGPEGSGRALYLLNLQDGRVLYLPKGAGSITAVAFTRDGDRLAAKGNDAVYIYSGLKNPWRLAAGPKAWAKLTLTGLAGARLAFAPDGKRLALTTGYNGTLRIWDVTGTAPKVVKVVDRGHPQIRGLAWSPDSQRLVTLHRLNLPLGKPPWPPVVRVWSPDGKSISNYTAADLQKAGVLKLNEANLQLDTVQFCNPRELLLHAMSGARRFTAQFFLEAGRPLGFVLNSRSPFTVQTRSAAAVTPNGRLEAVSAAPEGHRIAVFPVRNNAVARYLQENETIFSQVGWSGPGYTLTWSTGKLATPRGGLDLTRPEFVLRPEGPVTWSVTERNNWKLRVVNHNDASFVELTRALPKGNQKMGKAKMAQPKLAQQSANGFIESATLPASGIVNWFAWTSRGGLYSSPNRIGAMVKHFEPRGRAFRSVSSSPDGKYLAVYSSRELYHIYDPAKTDPLLNVYVSGHEWIVWTEEGYYAASPGAEQFMGWTVNQGLQKLAKFYPAEQFRNVLYRPDVIRLVLDKGSVEQAVKVANAERLAKNQKVPGAKADLDELLPPTTTLRIVRQNLPQVTLEVTAEQGCATQPIKSLRLLVDGRPLPNQQAYVTFPAGKEKQRHQETWNVALPPGKHTLSVLARSKDDTPSVSDPIEVACPLSPNQRPQLHHLAVGVNAYDKAPKLKSAVDDTKRLRQALPARNAWHAPGVTTELLDQNATCAAVLAALSAVRKAAKPNDLFVFSFAGHGIRAEGQFYLLTKEADPTNVQTLDRTALSGTVLREKLVDFPCQVLLLLDTGRASAFANYRPGSDEAARTLTDVDVRVTVMSAAVGNEEALEQKGQGLFTDAVVRALNKAPNVFFDPQTGELNVYHLQAFVYQEVARASDYKQTPYLKLPLAHPPFVVTQFK